MQLQSWSTVSFHRKKTRQRLTLARHSSLRNYKFLSFSSPRRETNGKKPHVTSGNYITGLIYSYGLQLTSVERTKIDQRLVYVAFSIASARAIEKKKRKAENPIQTKRLQSGVPKTNHDIKTIRFEASSFNLSVVRLDRSRSSSHYRFSLPCVHLFRFHHKAARRISHSIASSLPSFYSSWAKPNPRRLCGEPSVRVRTQKQ